MKTHPSHRTLITAPALAAVLLAIITVLISSSTLAAQDGLQPPTDLAASRDGSSATVTWNHAAAADHYVIAIREAGTKDYTRSGARNTDPYSFPPNPITEKRVSISGLREGQTHRVKVRAVISRGDDTIRSRWTHLRIRPRENQQSAADPSNEPPGEGSVSRSARNSFETAVREGVAFQADGYWFELIPGADFLMAFTSEPGQDRNTGRAPSYDINFSCVGGPNGAAIINQLPESLTYGDDPDDSPDLGYQLYYDDPDDNRQTFDLVPQTITAVDEYHTRRRHMEDCPADSETDGIVRNDILAWPGQLYTWNLTHSIMERWMLSTNSQGIQWTREPHLDIPLHRNTRQNKGSGLFSDSHDLDPLKHIIWQVHDFGTDDDKFMPYRHLTLASIPDQAVDFPTLPNTATQQISRRLPHGRTHLHHRAQQPQYPQVPRHQRRRRLLPNRRPRHHHRRRRVRDQSDQHPLHNRLRQVHLRPAPAANGGRYLQHRHRRVHPQRIQLPAPPGTFTTTRTTGKPSPSPPTTAPSSTPSCPTAP